jgi:hypothetical protein
MLSLRDVAKAGKQKRGVVLMHTPARKSIAL